MSFVSGNASPVGKKEEDKVKIVVVLRCDNRVFKWLLPVHLYPGHDILSLNEKKLCANLRLTPAHYITYKTW